MKPPQPTCGVCRRTIDHESKRVAGLGQVGPDCYRRVAELERAFSLLEYAHRENVARAIRDTLRKLGFNAHMRYVQGHYQVFLKGGSHPDVEPNPVARSVLAQRLLAEAEIVAEEEAC